ncbi:tRNA (guanosine(37)-N1)-methyltransferase TrmD [Candidatus Uhrbacteria bacterium RIFOXYB12_FULL_58_10]|uniref:tRNA (guanine-N(1)-)-methyltransferase n=1 Tax=Candidatus Uhrbacteria bacterium RIFOXYB2_FULL_57_15 TaxID=1802422 RepID=A0A1F7W612_9BACT|nr:MAG: tRNA (guanosine(37)-N1)-methyltransferase TrmD [Candidatus Uhrbacteria bacterium RIFOXYB12_FULL_58_10]OGL98252.1 MAG: tRNA (guanosine(37)-N1)-methyltransferase TrmD [Candidatus Uhrbacteria bacterium RIFOXYB2_FULL_57_15]OGL98941.1 MAG: tRNA (guanosine(37)-N1)-methyltransferase TrmD [Candidatus Uhrbacteria bacterium RIFOXYC12_FULL_57_11]
MPKQKLRRYDVLTIFPDMISGYASESILGRAQEKKRIDVRAHDLRDWAEDKHRRVDDTPYGGGPGMVMKVDMFERGVRNVRGKKGEKVRVILTSASGKTFTQQDARRLAKYDQLIFLCGRYEGVDARVEDHVADEAFSIGNYVLTGGELPALVMIDAVARHVPGVLGAKESLAEESHTEEGMLEYPQYTKPPVYKKWSVPDVLMSGDHKKIEAWRKEQARHTE